MSTKKIIIGIAVLLLLGGIIYFFMNRSSSAKMNLATASVSRSTITNMVTATGTVEPLVEVEVGTQVSGIIDKIYVDYNSTVKKGQLIAEMDKVTLAAELASAEAQLSSSKAEFEYQQRNYERSKLLHERQLISDTDFENATYTYQIAKASYDQSQASMVRVRQNLGYATITSPIDGIVISRAVEEGQTVAAGFSTPTLFTIANDLAQMEVVADVDEADIGQVEEGQRVTFSVDAYPNDIFEGEVTQVRLEATVTSNVVTYEVVISAYNPDLKLKPGLTANVTIYTLERNDVLTLPTRALRFVPDPDALSKMGYEITNPEADAPAGKRLVWEVQGTTLLPKIISIGATSGSMTEIIEGINEGQIVAVDLTTETPVQNGNNAERSPFMPGPPGRR
ncbi:MAG: efflux RND transporter periplasmic adaptor subunit [Tannerellaceae bacterium]|nr:efflux RND transporter periplasmic adaptor subunit [Tannerellaceae bacterium]